VAAEHLRDADPDGLLRPDGYARPLAYSIDLFTTDHPFPHDIAVPRNHHRHRKTTQRWQFSSPTPKWKLTIPPCWTRSAVPLG
jgi:hypothetical protein